MSVRGALVFEHAVHRDPASENRAIALCHNAGDHGRNGGFDRVRPGQSDEVLLSRHSVLIQVVHRTGGAAGAVDLVSHSLDRGRHQWFRAAAGGGKDRLGPECATQVIHGYRTETNRGRDNHRNPRSLQHGNYCYVHALDRLSAVYQVFSHDAEGCSDRVARGL